ncbi:unnamed protein product, partial [Phaeothamnion confervicola]
MRQVMRRPRRRRQMRRKTRRAGRFLRQQRCLSCVFAGEELSEPDPLELVAVYRPHALAAATGARRDRAAGAAAGKKQPGPQQQVAIALFEEIEREARERPQDTRKPVAAAVAVTPVAAAAAEDGDGVAARGDEFFADNDAFLRALLGLKIDESANSASRLGRDPRRQPALAPDRHGRDGRHRRRRRSSSRRRRRQQRRRRRRKRVQTCGVSTVPGRRFRRRAAGGREGLPVARSGGAGVVELRRGGVVVSAPDGAAAAA